jgi:hypothetical protein
LCAEVSFNAPSAAGSGEELARVSDPEEWADAKSNRRYPAF